MLSKKLIVMKAVKTIIIIVLVIVLIPLLGYATWFLKKGEYLRLFVVNKSLVEFRGSENKSFNFILNEEKIVTSGNRRYKMDVDHYGLTWNKGDYQVKFPRLKDLKRISDRTDFLYYADVSGIMKSDVRKLKEGEKDEIEYGGLNNSDYTMIRYMMEMEKPIVIECGFYGGPTDPLVRYNIEKLIDIYYVGWMGTYMTDLAGTAANPCGFDYKARYEEYTGDSWDFSGPGIVLVNTDANRVIVLVEGEDIQTDEGLIVTDTAQQEQFNLPGRVNYTGWFSVLHPGRNDVVSTFALNPTISGSEKLMNAGLPESFPALIQGNGDLFFMAGDFGKSNVSLLFSRVPGVRDVITAIRGSGKLNPSNFFYTYYRPFMKKMVDDARKVHVTEE